MVREDCVVRAVFVATILAGIYGEARLAAGQDGDVLSSACAVEWRGEACGEALAALAARLDVPYVLDASVDEAALARPVRMSASHLTGEESFRWLARCGGLSAVLVDGVFLVARQDRLPAAWRATGRCGVSGRGTDAGRWDRIKERPGEVKWLDMPLSGVASDVSALFGVDVVFDGAILAEGRFVSLEGPQQGVEAVLEALEGQLGARTAFVDGAVWVWPADGDAGLPPAWIAAAETPEAGGPVGVDPLGQPVRIDRSVTSWRALTDCLSAATGIACRAQTTGGGWVSYPGIEATGSAGDFLAAIQLLDWASWTLEPVEAGRPPEIVMWVGKKN